MENDMRYLFGFPAAGSGPNVYNIWKDRLKNVATFHQISYNSGFHPGRPYCDNMEEASRLSAQEIRALIQEGDEIWFYGHCMGASVAYETAVRLKETDGIQIQGLFFSAFIAPDVPIKDGIADWDDEAFAKEIHSHGTFPEEFFTKPSLLKLFLPKIRADYRLIETYCDHRHVVLDCPIVGFFGRDDESVPLKDLEGWANYTSVSFTPIFFPGNHYFYYDHQPEIIDKIIELMRNGGTFHNSCAQKTQND